MKTMNRRSFMKGAALGAAAPFFIRCVDKTPAGKKTRIREISVVEGEDYFANTVKAVEQLGGMDRFVPKNARVAILANPQRNNPGAFTKPAVLAAAIRMCREAGAASVTCISQLPRANWESTGLLQAVEDEGADLQISDRSDESQFQTVPVPQGKALKEARILKSLFQHDVFIDMPVTKDHAGNKFTGTMKNLMGLNSGPSNRTFHKENWTTDPNSIAHLDQCIADLNTVVTPDLCIVDATEFIITNGPFGPGEIITPRKVVAGNDRVAMDAYCCSLWGLRGEDIIMIRRAHEHGLGTMDLAGVPVLEATA